MRLSRGNHQRGSTFQDYLIAISVVSVATIGAGALFVNNFREGSSESGQKMEQVLSGDRSLGSAQSEGVSSGGGLDGSHPGPPLGQGGIGEEDGEGTGAEPSTAPGKDDSSSQKAAPPANAPDGPSKCRYSYDAASSKWKDPATGDYVSDTIAAQSGC